MRPATSKNELSHFFDYEPLGLQVVEDGLTQLSFGEYLVSLDAISRQELFLALQLQDRDPDLRLGQCLVTLGTMNARDVDQYVESWNRLSVVEA